MEMMERTRAADSSARHLHRLSAILRIGGWLWLVLGGVIAPLSILLEDSIDRSDRPALAGTALVVALGIAGTWWLAASLIGLLVSTERASWAAADRLDEAHEQWAETNAILSRIEARLRPGVPDWDDAHPMWKEP
jgi:hypothetical protein